MRWEYGFRVAWHGGRPDAAVVEVVTNVVRGFPGRQHEIAVRVCAAPTVTDGRGGFGFAALVIGGEPLRITIWVAGQCPPKINRREWLREMLPESVLHELVHYEQWRGGRALTERGVAVRVRNLLWCRRERT
jgi:hypothetical protein